VDSNADDRPRTTGKQETWIEDARVGCLEAAVPGFVRRKGRSGCRISALEADMKDYRLTILMIG